MSLVAQEPHNQRVEPTDTEHGRLRAVSESIGVVGEGILVAPYRRLTRKPLSRLLGSGGESFTGSIGFQWPSVGKWAG
jgi:hypothetical protein